MVTDASFIFPDWPAPANVHVVTTTRAGGVSDAPYDSFNLADHVDDDRDRVARNRSLLRERLHLPSEPLWLHQVHGTTVVDATGDATDTGVGLPGADGSVSRQAGRVCAVLTADCLPIVLSDRRATRIAVLHAGWRGLAGGILARGVASLAVAPEELLVWLGPAIGPAKFEVGPDVVAAFVGQSAEAHRGFRRTDEHHWLADLYTLARLQCRVLGVPQVFGGEYCTFSDSSRFYSYRRDGVTGRMATLAWLEI